MSDDRDENSSEPSFFFSFGDHLERSKIKSVGHGRLAHAFAGEKQRGLHGRGKQCSGADVRGQAPGFDTPGSRGERQVRNWDGGIVKMLRTLSRDYIAHREDRADTCRMQAIASNNTERKQILRHRLKQA